jgi:hypothetical protein
MKLRLTVIDIVQYRIFRLQGRWTRRIALVLAVLDLHFRVDDSRLHLMEPSCEQGSQGNTSGSREG